MKRQRIDNLLETGFMDDEMILSVISSIAQAMFIF